MKYFFPVFCMLIVSFFLKAQPSVGLTEMENPTQWIESELGDKHATILGVRGKLLFFDVDSATDMLYAVSANETDVKPSGKGQISAYNLKPKLSDSQSQFYFYSMLSGND